MPGTTESLNNYLLAHRNRVALTQKDIAMLLGKSDTTIRRHEAGIRLPPIMELLAYEAVFGTPVRELFAGIDEAVRHAVTTQARKLLVEIERDMNAASQRLAHIRGLAANRSSRGNE